MESFELYMFSFGAVSFDVCSFLARIVVVAEGVLGVWLASGQFHRVSRILVASFLTFFSGFLLWRIALGDHDSCHCMGDVIDMSPLQSLIKNLVLAAVLAFIWNAGESPFRHRCTFLTVLSVIVSVAVFAVSPPDAMFRFGRSSNDLSEDQFRPIADSLSLSSGRRIVCFYSTGCEHCRHCASKMSGIIRRHNLPADSISVVFMQSHVKQDSLIRDFYSDYGNGLQLSYSVLHPYVFLPVTNGSMPLVVLMEDGRVVKEYDYLTIDENEIRFYLTK